MKKKIFLAAVILGGMVSLLTLASCAKEESETTIVYYNLLDANGRQVNVSVQTAPEASE
jgi:hypothetical protein